MVIDFSQQPDVPIEQLFLELDTQRQWKDKVAGIARVEHPSIHDDGRFYFCPSLTRSLKVEHPGKGKARKVSGVEIHGFDDWRLLAHIPLLTIENVRYEVLRDTLHFTILPESLAISYDRLTMACGCSECQEFERTRPPLQVVSQRSIRDVLADARMGNPLPLPPKRHYVTVGSSGSIVAIWEA